MRPVGIEPTTSCVSCMHSSTELRAHKFLSRWPDLNRRPTPYHGVALPTELQRQIKYPEPPLGFEPRTFTLQKCCSTTELRWQKFLTLQLLCRCLSFSLPRSEIKFLLLEYELIITHYSKFFKLGIK